MMTLQVTGELCNSVICSRWSFLLLEIGRCPLVFLLSIEQNHSREGQEGVFQRDTVDKQSSLMVLDHAMSGPIPRFYIYLRHL